ncbi:MAG TPA: acyl-CoA dehydrogenase family protein, partial [Rhodospirillales bacterium]
MDFQLTADQRQLRDTARQFATREMSAVARELEEKDQPLGRDHVRRYAEMGFLGVNVAEELGGLGLGNL